MKRIYLILLAVAFQVAIVAGMVIQSLIPLYTGVPIDLRVYTRDPRDMFRGNYVVMSYDFNTIHLDSVKNDIDTARAYNFGDVLYVGLCKKGRFYTPASLRQHLPDAHGDTVYVKGIVQYPLYGRQISLKCGVESYYTTPETAKNIERRLANRIAVNDSTPPDTVVVTVMVSSSGKARIKQLNWQKMPI